MDLNKSKMKNIKAWLELEPNFPGVATPQSSEWIIYKIYYAYNPFTAPWGVPVQVIHYCQVDAEYTYLFKALKGNNKILRTGLFTL